MSFFNRLAILYLFFVTFSFLTLIQVLIFYDADSKKFWHAERNVGSELLQLADSQ